MSKNKNIKSGYLIEYSLLYVWSGFSWFLGNTMIFLVRVCCHLMVNQLPKLLVRYTFNGQPITKVTGQIYI